jgi:hypothetical protein
MMLKSENSDKYLIFQKEKINICFAGYEHVTTKIYETYESQRTAREITGLNVGDETYSFLI